MGNNEAKAEVVELGAEQATPVQLEQELNQNQETDFVRQIENQNKKNVKSRNSSISLSPNVQQSPKQQKLDAIVEQSSPINQKRLSRKSASKSELPPLKLKNSSKLVPLNNRQNLSSQVNNLIEDIEEVNYEKPSKKSLGSVANLSENPTLKKLESEQLKENRTGSNCNVGSTMDISKNSRPKKFRPSQNSAVKKSANIIMESNQDAIEI